MHLRQSAAHTNKMVEEKLKTNTEKSTTTTNGKQSFLHHLFHLINLSRHLHHVYDSVIRLFIKKKHNNNIK